MGGDKVIIDTDVGCDDAAAIGYALSRQDLDLLAFTTCFGFLQQQTQFSVCQHTCIIHTAHSLIITSSSRNLPVERCTESLKIILRVMNNLEVPVYTGACSSLVHLPKRKCWAGHGSNGLGGVDLLKEFNITSEPNSNVKHAPGLSDGAHAVFALVSLINRHPGEVHFIALGPLTNLALALKIDPSIAQKVRRVTMMGGSYLGRGNSTVLSEVHKCTCG